MVLKFDKQYPRVSQVSKDSKKVIAKEDKRAARKLPTHMHNIQNRLVCNNVLERTLRDNKHEMADWLKTTSNIANKKNFRVDPNNEPPAVYDP